MARTRNVSKDSEGERLTATDRLERSIQEDILVGELAPGARMKPSLLAPTYGVSVTPFREVLARLESRGLVVSDPWVGARVAPVSADECEDIYRLRLLVEREALKDSVRNGDDEWLKRLKKSARALASASQKVPTPRHNARERTLEWLTIHREFHVATVAACTSLWTLRVLDNIYDHLDRYQAMAWDERGLRPPSLKEHRDILSACLDRNPKTAAAALEVHLASAVAWITHVIRTSTALGNGGP